MHVACQQISQHCWRAHACAVQYQQNGILITGAPASGKTTLLGWFLAQGGVLVGDDYVDVTYQNMQLNAAPVKEIQCLIAPRGGDAVLKANCASGAVLTHHVHLPKTNKDLLIYLPFLQYAPLAGFFGLPAWEEIENGAQAYFSSLPVHKKLAA